MKLVTIDGGKPVDKGLYQSMIGGLVYLSTAACPNIAQVVTVQAHKECTVLPERYSSLVSLTQSLEAHQKDILIQIELMVRLIILQAI